MVCAYGKGVAGEYPHSTSMASKIGSGQKPRTHEVYDERERLLMHQRGVSHVRDQRLHPFFAGLAL